MKKCVLHIGSEKTGTTSIQKYFSTNRAQLLRQGFWYPQAGAHPKEGVHLGLSSAGLQRGLTAGNDLVESFRAERAAMTAKGATTGVISSEFFHSQYRDQNQIEHLATFLREFFESVVVVYYARRQDLLAVSMHSTAVRGGWTTKANALSVYEVKGHHYFDHLVVANVWAAIFGSDNLVCRVYEPDKLKGRDVVADLSSIIGLDLTEMDPPTHANESLSHVCLNALLLLNRSIHKDNQLLRRKIIQSDKQLQPRERIPAMTDSEARSFLHRFDESNRLFFSRYVDHALATDFAKNFDGHLERIPEVSPDKLLSFIFRLRQNLSHSERQNQIHRPNGTQQPAGARAPMKSPPAR